MSKQINRRNLIKYSALGLGSIVISNGLESMAFGGLNGDEKPIKAKFLHGVASGDPLQDSIILWTRVTPHKPTDKSITVRWIVSTDSRFKNLTHSGVTETSSADDYTIKIDARNLEPGRRYFYRFYVGRKKSPTGTFKTLAAGSLDQVKLAVVSCSNFPRGYFNAYAEAAKTQDLDAVVHLGDYIYEYGMGEYGTEYAEEIGRALPDNNSTECLTLEDYRRRYALYRGDKDLQRLHATAAFIAVWDDHEITDDTYKDGAYNHNEGEGDFEERKQAALKAYFEWMPVRPFAEGDNETIYRSFSFGDLVDLHMLDTRVTGRQQQLSYDNYIDPQTGAFDGEAFIADVSDPNRTLMGAEQLQWLQGQLVSSTGRWQVLGQQVLMSRILLPVELLLAFSNPDLFASILPELVDIKTRLLAGDDSLTEAEIARVTTTLPINLDAWDGYAYQREVVLGTALAASKNLVVLAGDTHNSWASNLRDYSGNHVGVEFAVSSVTSPGIEQLLNLNEDTAQQVQSAFETLVDDLNYNNIFGRGLMIVTFTQAQAQSEWIYVDNIMSRDYGIAEAQAHQVTVAPGEKI